MSIYSTEGVFGVRELCIYAKVLSTFPKEVEHVKYSN